MPEVTQIVESGDGIEALLSLLKAALLQADSLDLPIVAVHTQYAIDLLCDHITANSDT